MSTKNYFGGAIINYGGALPSTTGVPDGALFFKTAGADAGLFIYNFVQDTSSATLGDQSAQLWSPVTGTGVSVDATTLDGLDSTAFQLTSSFLNALSGLGASTGILVKTGASSVATRAITGDSTITISPAAGDGVASNIQVAVNQGNLALNSIGGILSLAKGGTGTNLTITQGGIIFGTSTSSLASTPAGTVGWLLKANGSAAPTWMDPATITVGAATSASSASVLSPGRQINGVLFNGSTDITVTANTPQSVTFVSGGSGAGGASPGATFNGSTARTISYNTIGAPSTTGVNASGTWGISITGNANYASSAGSAASAGTAGSASSATQLATARSFSITGGATAAAVSFDGTGNVALNVTALDASDLTGTIATGRMSGTYTMNITGNASGNLRLDGSNQMAAGAQLKLDYGTAGEPALTFAGDLNTGLYSPGANGNQIIFVTGGAPRLTVGATDIVTTEPIFVPNPNTTAGGTVEVGFRRVPLANMTSGTLTAATSGCAVAAAGTITVDNGVFTGGDVVTVYNDTASSITIAQASGMTLYGDAGATGNKTVPPRGLVTIWFRSASVAKVTGEMS